MSELLQGVRRASPSERVARNATVEQILDEFDPVPITEAVARVHADAWAELAAHGSVIGAHDLWIAATALTHGLGVVTLDPADFGRVHGLRVVAP